MSVYHKKPNTFVSHLHLEVKNLNRSLKFYQQLMGFQVLSQSENKTILTANGLTPLLTIEQPLDVVPRQPSRTGLYHYALLFPTRKDLGKLLALLLSEDYPLQGASNHGSHDALYFQDPDGHGIEVTVDADPETWVDENGKMDFPPNGPMNIESVLALTNGEKWDGLPTETIIGHIHLYVANLEKSREFYHEGLGLDMTMEIPGHAIFFSSGGYHHHIATNNQQGKNALRPEINSVGMRFYTLFLPNKETRKSLVMKLEAMGYQVITEKGELFTEDPSGNRIHLYC